MDTLHRARVFGRRPTYRESLARARVGVTQENAALRPWAGDDIYLPESSRPLEPPLYRHTSISLSFLLRQGAADSGSLQPLATAGANSARLQKVILFGRLYLEPRRISALVADAVV